MREPGRRRRTRPSRRGNFGLRPAVCHLLRARRRSPSHSARWDASAADSAALVEAVRGLDLPAEPGIAYVAGEARTVQAVRARLVRERGRPRRSVLVKPFWTPGERGME
ncbi:SIP domain-containing protein [Actinomadura bangladeshensis]|uniref:SIP-like Rossmann fold domain-containing protein n=1 Tax=Actinomadura bangladeshensis TaxID=453573 RepID=A0A4R4P3B5_9ACTN|nr:SIP domain-containing protein [Actinomadura bangladeshensis]TDC16841.1 hypothetical protein E1284_11335 [Actinomadura bangladeshensis]